RPAPQAKSSAGPTGSSGSNSRTNSAGSADGSSAAAKYFASQSDALVAIKKAPEHCVQEPGNPQPEPTASDNQNLHAERTAATASALHIGVVKLESRALE